MKKFIVVSTDSANEFEITVNEYLEKGYTLYGFPAFALTSSSDQWDGRMRSITRRQYVQCLIYNEK
jgi:hypothetical protein